MVAALVAAAFFFSGASANMMVGVNFAPFTEEEWSYLSWMPMWRVEIDQAADVASRGKVALLLAKAEDDSSVDALMPYLNSSWGIELGNEPDINGHDPINTGRWYIRMYQKLKAAGYPGFIITAGVSSISKKARGWLAKSLSVGLPSDMVIGWHGYDGAINNLGYLPGLVGGHRHAMTEFGIPETSVAGAICSVWYQMHDGAPGTKENNFGVHAYDGHWRPVVNSLQSLLNS